MNRKSFLKGLGLAGASSVLPFDKALARTSEIALPPNACPTLIPSETEGPFPLDLTANTTFFRKAANETQTGVALNVKLRIVGAANCLPMKNVRVNIWHCTKDGIYSGYNNAMNAGTVGSTYCRAYQFTDNNGVAAFTTIFPGWYNGRIAHIHFKVTVSTAYGAVSQLTFPIAEKNALYAANPALYPKGADPMSVAADNVFSDGVAFQLSTLTKNADGSYDAFLEVTVNGTGTTGVGHAEKENAKQFSIGQNFPNPFDKTTTIPFKLINGGDVTIDLYDLNGRKIATLLNENNMLSGEHQCLVNFQELGLATENYMYQIEVKNSDGLFKDVKMMTAAL
jgi:protocatechuate 3,4-dioxygenase beta subunit